MRHQKKGRKFGRNTNQRKALLRNLIESLIIHEEIKTTESKAKTLKQLVDKLITKAKIGSLHVRRQIFSFLPNKKAVNKLVEEIAPRFKQRTAGFTRFVRLGNRHGDNAMMVKMELVEKKAKNIKVPKVSEVSKVDKDKVK